MSDSLLVALYAVAGVLEAGGLTVVAFDLRSTLQAARRWREAGPPNGGGTSWNQFESLDGLLAALAGSRPKLRTAGVVALIAGLIVATVANVASVLR